MKKSDWGVSRFQHSSLNDNAFGSDYWDREISKLETWFDSENNDGTTDNSSQEWQPFRLPAFTVHSTSARLRHTQALSRVLSTHEAGGRATNPESSSVEVIVRLIVAAAEDLGIAESNRGHLDIDAEYVGRRLSQILGLEAAKQWVTSQNSRLGTSPALAVASGRLSEVVEALDARESFSY